MGTDSRKRVLDRSGRSVGNIYDRLEAARKQRAEALAAPKPANDAGPAKAAVVEPTLPKPRKEHLPTIRPQSSSSSPAKPRKSRLPLWHFALAVAIMALLVYVYSMPLQKLPDVQDGAQMLTPPKTEFALIGLPRRDGPVTWAISGLMMAEGPARAPLVDTASVRPDVETSVQAPKITLSDISPAPRQMAVSKPAKVAMIAPLQPPPLPPTESATVDPTKLRISLNVPIYTSEATVIDLVSNARAAGLDIGDPRIVDFAIKSTQVRFFHKSDQVNAEFLASSIGGVARDFTFFEPLPPTGFVEVFVSGIPEEVTTRRSDGAFDSIGQDLRQVGDRLRATMRSLSR